VPWNFSPEYTASHEALLAAARERYRKLDLPAVARLCACFLKVDFTGSLGLIRTPACVVVGERDLLKGRDYAEILHRGIAGSELHVLPGAGHASCWERAAEFNTIVLGFLAKQAG
jgi:3-oxoadipate enol-lactonase